MNDLRHAGVGFPNGAVDNGAVFALPSANLLMLATEGRYHHDAAVAAGKRVLWRSIPRIGKRPAELGWSPVRFVGEAINLADAPSQPIGDLVWANELDLNSERGDGEDDWQNLERRYALIGGWAYSVVQMLKQWSPQTRIHWPAWTPDHDALDHLGAWRDAASLCDVVDFHAYDSLANIQRQYTAHRQAFPSRPLALTEWHCKGDLGEEEAVLQWLALTMAEDPLFDAAYFFIWRWWDHPSWWSDAWDIEHDPDRLALFRSPPIALEPEPMPETKPWEFWSAEQIAEAAQVDVAAVRDTWPHVTAQLDLCGINRKRMQIGIIGTVAHETASAFRPVREGFYLGEEPDGNPDGLSPAERHRRTLTYYPHYGRGHVQLTHESNYVRYTTKLAELWGAGAPNLQANPNDALDADVGAAVIAMWFRDERALPSPTWPQGYSLQNACDLEDDEWIRRLVYGGRDPVGQARIARVRSMLDHGEAPSTLRYKPDQAPERQVQDWACSIRAAAWALKSVGVAIDAGSLQDEMVPGTVTPALGLLDGRGYGLAATLGRHVPAGTHIEIVENVSYSQLAGRAGRGPICLGSNSLYHWINVASIRGDGVFVAPNPSPRHQNIGDDLTPEEFSRWAPWNMVFVEVTPAEPTQPTPSTGADLATLVGVAYHEDGVVIPALVGAGTSRDWGQVEAVVKFLRKSNPDAAA